MFGLCIFLVCFGGIFLNTGQILQSKDIGPSDAGGVASPCLVCAFLASQDALEAMLFTYSLTEQVMVSIDLTDVTLVSDDTKRRLDLCDSGK